MKKVGTVSDIRELTDAEIGAVAGGISGEGVGTAVDQTSAAVNAANGVSSGNARGLTVSPGFGVLTSPGQN